MKQVFREKTSNFIVECQRCDSRYTPRVNAVPWECKKCGSTKLEKIEKQRKSFTRDIQKTLQLLESFLEKAIRPQLCSECRDKVEFSPTDFREKGDDN